MSAWPMNRGRPAGWEIVLAPQCLQDLAHWVEHDRTLALKVLTLVEQASRDPFGGLGKPELLKHLGSGYMSRRISQEHRLVYHVAGRTLQFLSARFHYDKK